MALNNPTKQTQTIAVVVTRGSGEPEPVTGEEDEEEVGEEELKQLEMEAEAMARKILEYRNSLPDQLKTTLTSILSSQRPNLPDFDRDSTADVGEEGASSQSGLPAIRDQKIAEKLHLLKERISSNTAAMPVVVNRVKECISKIDNLDSQNRVIHPVFKKKKTS